MYPPIEKLREQKISKFISYVLRHKPIVEIDKNGWANVSALIKKAQIKILFDFNELKHVVQSDDKNRFELSDDFCEIRCSQGHSIKVDLNYKAEQPPITLYHGTPSESVEVIMKEGLKKMSRHHTHLSEDIETAETVGARRGRFTVLEIDAAFMHFEGHKFYKSTNGVWLTDHVPTKYIHDAGYEIN